VKTETRRPLSPAPTAHRSVAEVVFAAMVACSAYAGAVGLMTGTIDMGHELNHRLPLHSPVLGGAALAVIVGLPTTAVALLAWRRTVLGARRAAIVAGVLLVGWIGVELAFIREFSFLQPLFVLVGLVFVALGRRRRRDSGQHDEIVAVHDLGR
jgi:hypothetical protein